MMTISPSSCAAATSSAHFASKLASGVGVGGRGVAVGGGVAPGGSGVGVAVGSGMAVG